MREVDLEHDQAEKARWVLELLYHCWSLWDLLLCLFFLFRLLLLLEPTSSLPCNGRRPRRFQKIGTRRPRAQALHQKRIFPDNPESELISEVFICFAALLNPGPGLFEART